MNVKPKVAIITGGLSGIGKAIARRFLQDGMIVCIGARRGSDPLLSADLSAVWGERVWVSALDVGESASVARFVQQAEAHAGPVDILVNAAGIYQEQSVEGHSDALWDDTLNIILSGTFRMIRAVMPGMMQRKWGRIVNIASMAAHTGMAGNAAYCASKAGLLGLGRCVSLVSLRRKFLPNRASLSRIRAKTCPAGLFRDLRG